MAEKDCTVTELSPANPETETESPESGAVLEMARAGNMTDQSFAGAATGEGVLDSGAGGPVGSLGTAKRKRGRPRKYDNEVNAGAAAAAVPMFSGVSATPVEASPKRGRGRPKGSGKLQVLASAGVVFSNTAGGSFTPYVETVHAGEDVVGKILSFSQKSSRAMCVLSATGTVSSVIIRQPGSSSGTLRYEGRFEILSLSGSYAFGESAGARRKIGMLSVSLAKPDGRVFGGAVAGSLIAAGPIQLVVGSFKQSAKKELQRKRSAESSMAAGAPGNSDMARVPEPAARMVDGEENCVTTPTSELSEPNNGGASNVINGDQNVNFASLDSVCWNTSQPSQPTQPLSEQMTSPEINASVPEK
ncbi:AT-hook motif nuclear-localized protein 9-like [Malania oleifera]|uniref:AT-hook motif nuclear-localized protein 9-like n=1 Tax=Malania oleifera TaxID=397392 RepID=UPI0025ADE32A|nr:AT-hook motif nuclear-localized protein 9-like [Malania oleifera]